MQFSELRLSDPILRAVHSAGYTSATPIQVQAIPPALDGHDLLGCAQTGTGKTAAFSLPILQRLSAEPVAGRPIRALIVTPTRELAAQIVDSLRTYGKNLPLRSTVIFGGVSQVNQVDALRRGVDILVATPGRLLDLMDQGYIRLDRVEVLVLDEADRMLDMGFVHDIRRIIKQLPTERQTLFFSATMPDEIRSLASTMLIDPVQVAITPQATAAETVIQRVYLVERDDKQALLAHLLRDSEMTKALVFTRTKHGADRVARRLSRDNIEAEAIHGGKSQNNRMRVLESFRRGQTRVLVASDIAARGLDIDDISHIINFDLPNEPETYVHRIGRTGRAGARGVALSFCAGEERGFLRSIERTVRSTVPVDDDHPYHAGFTKLPVDDRQARGGGGAIPRRTPAPRRAPAQPGATAAAGWGHGARQAERTGSDARSDNRGGAFEPRRTARPAQQGNRTAERRESLGSRGRSLGDGKQDPRSGGERAARGPADGRGTARPASRRAGTRRPSR